MDALEKWYAQIVDVKTLFSHWHTQMRAGLARRKRSREILTVCFFTLCLENNENKRFLVGFQQRGVPGKPGPVFQLFQDGFGEIEDVDVILVPDLGVDGPAIRDIHRCQIVGYLERPDPSTEDLISFLEEKKLRVAANDDDLILILHLEQPIAFDWVKLSIHLQMRRPKVPYSQIFLLAQTGLDPTKPIFSCRQVYPRMLPMRDMDLESATTILADRKTVCPFIPKEKL
ncbi:MAG: hypothetical protein QOI04_1561 [Verrucomicrobiota bacterium]|jgi:hypothetical protein